MTSSITLDFFSEIKTIQLPLSFSSLLGIIRNEYVLSAEDLKNLQLKYMDSDNDLIILGNEEDFKMFAELVDKKEARTVLIDLTEQSKIMRSDIVDMKEINEDKGIINNFVDFLHKIPGGMFFK